MAGAINKKSERSLSELLNIFRAPFSEDHSWAVCYQCARNLQKLRDELSIADIPTLSLTTVYITCTGGVEIKKTKKLHARSSESSESAYQSMKEVISDLGMLVYDLLDYGLDDNEERALPQKFEHLIDCMTSDDDISCTSDIGSDCDSDSDQILGIIRSTTTSISLQEIIQVCESQVSSSVSTGTRYQLMCKRLFEEASELVGLAAEENDEVQDKTNHREKWSDVLKDVEIGKTLKKVSSTITDSVSSPILSAHEIVQLSVKSFSRDNLKPVLVNSNKGTGRITDPHMLLMQEIRAIKPNLRPVSERAKGHCMARALTPMEILMEEIRTPPTLRRVHNTMSDSVVVNNKKKLMPSPELVADLSEEQIENHSSCPVPVVNIVDTSVGDLRYGSCTELHDTSMVWGKPRSNSSPSSPRFSSSQRYVSPLCSTQSNMTTQSNTSMKAAKVEGASLEFKSISFSAVNGAEDCVFHRRRLYHSWHSEDALSSSRPMDESDSEGESVSHDARSLQSDDEFPSSIKELIQIRHILSKADLVNLQLFDNKTYREITRGKLCCACKRRRFSLMSRPHNCIVCQKLVCGKCVSKITLSADDLPSDHPVKLVRGRKNSSDACIPCIDFITSGGTATSHQQQVPGSVTSHSSSDQ